MSMRIKDQAILEFRQAVEVALKRTVSHVVGSSTYVSPCDSAIFCMNVAMWNETFVEALASDKEMSVHMLPGIEPWMIDSLTLPVVIAAFGPVVRKLDVPSLSCRSRPTDPCPPPRLTTLYLDTLNAACIVNGLDVEYDNARADAMMDMAERVEMFYTMRLRFTMFMEALVRANNSMFILPIQSDVLEHPAFNILTHPQFMLVHLR